VWANNPLTFGAIYYFSYKLGTILLGVPPHPFPNHMSLSWLISEFNHIWAPLWLGCILMGLTLALIGYIGLKMTWYVSIRSRWLKRQRERRDH